MINRTLGGCVGVRHYPTGVNALDFVDLQPGWTYTIESNGAGSNSRVQLSFSNPTTGEKAADPRRERQDRHQLASRS